MRRLPSGGGLGTGKRGTVQKDSFVLKFPGAFPGSSRPFYHNAYVVVTKMATKRQSRSHSPKKKRRIKWSDEEATEALLELWAEASIKMSLENSKSSKETRAVYENLKVRYIIVVSVRYRSYREI